MTQPMQPLDQIIETFDLLDDWQDKYAYLIDLGKTVPEMQEALKIAENEVKGCVSKVWMKADIRNGVFHFYADSNGQITKGMIGILMAAYQGLPIEEIKLVAIEDVFSRIGLEQNITPNRRNGFYAMVQRIKAFTG